MSFLQLRISFLISGAGSGLVPMYLTEIAPVNIRGAMGVLHQLALTCGILVSQLLGLRQLLGQSGVKVDGPPVLQCHKKLAMATVVFFISILVVSGPPVYRVFTSAFPRVGN